MIPIKDNIVCQQKPIVSWSIVAVCIALFALVQMLPYETQRQVFYQYGMVAIRYSNPHWSAAFGLHPDYYLSFFASLFLHSDWLHLLTNMWFMLIFAKSIEAAMGHLKFAVFYVLCGVGSVYGQWFFQSDLAIPVVGASGAIAGVLGAYLFLYPFARVVIWVPLFFLPIFFQIPAIAFLGFWIIIQLQNATSSLVFADTSTVAWWEHVAGFIMGITIHRFFTHPKPPLAQPTQTDSNDD